MQLTSLEITKKIKEYKVELEVLEFFFERGAINESLYRDELHRIKNGLVKYQNIYEQGEYV